MPHRTMRVVTLLAALVIATPHGLADSPASAPSNPSRFTIVSADADKDTAKSLEAHVKAGIARVEAFFGRPFERDFVVEICPDRTALDEYFHKRWDLPRTEKWMVASGVADRLVILSPRVWKTQAVEHDPADEQHVRQLVAHELVHVYHGQCNPRPDFDGMDEMGWFVEGLAVFVSGQLDSAHRTGAGEAIKSGKAPASLADAWSGRFRYAVCGSMVQFIDTRFGRETLLRLLGTTDNDQALAVLEMPETDFLNAWRGFVSGRE